MKERRSRSGVLAATAAIALACGGTTSTDGKDGSPDAKNDVSTGPVYGAPPYGVAPMPDAGDGGDAGAGDSGKPNDGGDGG